MANVDDQARGRFVQPENNWTLPNLLTISRILLTPGFVMAFVNHSIDVAWVLFAVAGFTDALDGILARLLKQRSRLGGMLDPLADKVLLVTSFICLSLHDWIPAWLTVMVVSRDVFIVGGLAVLHFWGVNISKRIQPLKISKLTTVAQIGLVLFVMVERSFDIDYAAARMTLVGITAILTAFSGIHYVLRGFSLFPVSENGPGKG